MAVDRPDVSDPAGEPTGAGAADSTLGQRELLAAFFPLSFSALRALLVPFPSAWALAFLPAFFLPAGASVPTSTVAAAADDAARDFLPVTLGTSASPADPAGVDSPSA